MMIRILLAVLLSFPYFAWAATWSVETLEMVHLKDARRYVCDPDNYLSAVEKDSIDAMLYRLERDKGIETVVIVAEHLQGDDPFRFGIDLSKKYGIGNKKTDTGLIVILSPGDRSYYILTGRGLEGVLPDAVCKRVEQRVMLPLLKQRRWGAALVETTTALDRIIREDPVVIKQFAAQEDDTDIIVGLLLILLFFGMIAYFATPRCPQCKKKKIKLIEQRHVRTPQGLRLQVVYQCSHCGKTFCKDQDPPSVGEGDLAAGVLLGGLLGSGGGHRRGSGGSWGGSFGGGSFGGGGAGGRF